MNQLIELQEVHIHSSWVEVYLIGHKILVDGKKLSKNIFSQKPRKHLEIREIICKNLVDG